MSRFDRPINADGDDERDILAIIDLNEAEVEAGWRQFSERHLQPDQLFRLAAGLEELSNKNKSHLEACERCRVVYQNYRLVDSANATNRHLIIDEDLTHICKQEEFAGDAPLAAGNGKPLGVPRSSSTAQQAGHAPDLLYEHLRIQAPIVFPGDEVAMESWQFGRILHIARTNAKLAEHLTDTIAEHAKTVLLPHLSKDNVMLVCFGRAMHRCGTRLAALLDDCGFGKTHVVLAHDFYSPTLICDPREFRNVEVFVLVDVVHTGGMLNRLLLRCRDYHPLCVRGLALIDQSDGISLSSPWFSVWTGEREARTTIEDFLRNTPSGRPEQLQRYEPNDECGVMTDIADLRHHHEAVIDNKPLSIDPELLEHVHVTGALKSDFWIGKKRYPFVINVLDLLKDIHSRQFIVDRAVVELSDLTSKRACLAYHAGRWQRAGAIAKLLGDELKWPIVPIGNRGGTFTLADRQYRQLACYNNVVIVDAAIRTGDSIAAIVRAVDDMWLRKHTRFTAFCVLDALSSVSQFELAADLGIAIRSLFKLPLTPPTQEVRHWVNAQKAILREQISNSDDFAKVRDVLGTYCEPSGWQRREIPDRPFAETRSLIEKATGQAAAALSGSASIVAACRENKAHFIRHLSVSEVVHDRSVQDLLVGIMFNSMKPHFKESAALALASVQNYDWMTLDWLRRNRPFLASPGNTWKSILLVECQMKLTDHTKELSRFRDAATEFRGKHLVSSKVTNEQTIQSQLLLTGIDLRIPVGDVVIGDGSHTTSAENRLRERVDYLVQAAS